MAPLFWITVWLAAVTSGVGQMLERAEPVGRIERLDPRLDRLIARDAAVRKLADGFVWAEGPLWDEPSGSLLLSDVPRNAVFRWHPDNGVSLAIPQSGYSGDQPFGGREPGSNGLAFDAEGRLILCQHGDRRLVRRERDGGLTVIADRFDGRRLNSPNDLAFRPGGDLYFTDPPFGLPKTFEDPDKELSFQGVYRVAADGTLHAVVTDLRAPNGIAFSPDGRVLYVSNSERSHPVWMAYEVAPDGSVSGGRQFAEASRWVQPSDGVPDGMKTDRDGNLFATGPGGVHVFAPDGTRLGRIETGMPTSNLAWAPDGTLYMTANHAVLQLKTLTGPAR